MTDLVLGSIQFAPPRVSPEWLEKGLADLRSELLAKVAHAPAAAAMPDPEWRSQPKGDAPEFAGFPKMARLSRTCTVQEKIDGTNGQIYIGLDSAPFTLGSGRVIPFMVGSRTRWILPENDNFGFARWAYENADELLKLGPGRHFGEWWGSKIQRGYGLTDGERRFSLFNTAAWGDERDRTKYPQDRPSCCHVVPVLYRGLFTTDAVNDALNRLVIDGSLAAPGFRDPEGIVVFHEAAGIGFKRTLVGDEQPKGAPKQKGTPRDHATEAQRAPGDGR